MESNEEICEAKRGTHLKRETQGMPRESKLPEQRREAEEQPETGQQTGGWGG